MRKKFEKKEFKKQKIGKRLKINERGKERETKKLGTHFSVNKSHMGAKIMGVILITIGFGFLVNSVLLKTIDIGFLFNSIFLNIKIGITLILIGIFVIFIFTVTRESKFKGISAGQITLVIIMWILSIFFITVDIDLDIFLILIIIGILTIKEVTDEFMNVQLKNRMKVLSYVFLIIFIVIIGQKIINILNI